MVKRIVVNATVSVLALTAAALFVQPTVQYLLAWTGQKQFGILHVVELHEVSHLVLALLLLDLSFYYWHRLNHRVPFLWRFHNVHHIDPDLDVTTGFRFHPGEVALSTGFRVVQVSLIGVNGWAFLIYEFIFQAGTLFHHSNLRLPMRLERFLNLVIVTPRMHGIHHSVLKSETNSNYSVVFSFWDRLHRSFNAIMARAQNDIGVPGYSGPDDNTVLQLLKDPLQKQRQYW